VYVHPHDTRALVGFYAARIGSLTFPDNPSVPSSSVQQSRKNTGGTYVLICVGNGVGHDWFSENVTLANSVSGAWRKRKRGRNSSCPWGTLKYSSWTAGPLKIGPMAYPKTSVTTYQSTLRKIPEELRFHSHRVRSLKSLPSACRSWHVSGGHPVLHFFQSSSSVLGLPDPRLDCLAPKSQHICPAFADHFHYQQAEGGPSVVTGTILKQAYFPHSISIAQAICTGNTSDL
jgi:hypothetical protein